MSTVTDIYRNRLKELGYHSDAAQENAIAALQQCQQDLEAYMSSRNKGFMSRWLNKLVAPQGVYMYGGVGRGKSFLMDCFFDAVNVSGKRRLHFHEFMREVHKQLRQLQGTVNPLAVLGKEIAEKHPLICFDEFHVSDVTDAMILHRLLEALFSNGACMVTTSNFHPDGLYPDGLQRESILPAIELLKQKMNVVCVDAGVDYRQRTLSPAQTYLTPLGAETDEVLQQIYGQVSEGPNLDTTIEVEHRKLQAVRCSANVGWFSFAQLCATPRSQNDYLELANRFDVLMLSNVPKMPPQLASEARRFTVLVDVLYDRRNKLILSAAVPPEQLYTEGALAYEFVRTVSRLVEMQSQEYLAEPIRRSQTDLV